MTDYRQTSYRAYLKEKTAVMSQQLRLSGSEIICASIVPSPTESGYRNRAKFKIFQERGHLRFMGTDPIRGEVPAEDSLWILPEWGRACVRSVSTFMTENFQVYPVDGFELQLAHGRKDSHLILSVKKGSSVCYEKFGELLIENINSLKGVAIPSLKKEYGEVFLKHRLLGIDIYAHYMAFFQSNIHLLPKLLQTLQSYFKDAHFNRMIDLYCGVGLFSLVLKDRITEIIGADSSQKAVESAAINRARLNLKHAKLSCTSVEKFLRALPLFRDDLVFLNPPRQGVSREVLETVASQKPRLICLVSCFLGTHLRDLRMWMNSGYTVRSFEAFDMFPFTDFLETVTILES